MHIKQTMIRIIFPFMLMVIVPISAGSGIYRQISAAATGVYFISYSEGNDSSDGNSPGSSWKTFQNLRNVVLQPGDKVLLLRGDTWNTRMTISAAGTVDQPVYVGPYGEINDPAPRITLTNDRDDICIVVQDLINTAPYNVGINYIHIDNLQLANSRVGIYFRNAVSSGNKGVKVTDCYFDNMNCEPVMTSMLIKDNIPGELNQSKGNLDQYIGYYQETGGGNSEYVWPVAIMIGGRRGLMDLKPGFSEIEIDNNIFEDCVTGVLAYYYNLPSATNFFKNMRFTNCQISGTINGIMAVLGMDAGNPELSPSSHWGVFRNLNIIEGSADQGFALGTTGLIIEDVANALFTDCNFSNVRNNGNPDGCGFDFESRGRNVMITSSVFANNEGQAILIMDNHDGSAPHKNVTIKDSLFYNNMQNVDSKRYRWDICVFNSGNSDILFQNNRHVSKVNTAGEAVERINSDEGTWIFEKPRSYGSETGGITEQGASFRRNDELSDFNKEISDKGLSAALKTVVLTQKTNFQNISSPTPSDPAVSATPATASPTTSPIAATPTAASLTTTPAVSAQITPEITVPAGSSSEVSSYISSDEGRESGGLSVYMGIAAAIAAFLLAMGSAYLVTVRSRK